MRCFVFLSGSSDIKLWNNDYEWYFSFNWNIINAYQNLILLILQTVGHQDDRPDSPVVSQKVLL